MRKLFVVLLLLTVSGLDVQGARDGAPTSHPQRFNGSGSIWRRFTAKDEEFSVLLPGNPTLFVSTITARPALKIPERIYSSYDAGSVYLIVSYNASSLKGTLENYKANHLYQGDVHFERDIRLGSYAGKEYKLKFGEVAGILRVFSTKRHGYAVATIQAREDSLLREYFLSSLALTEDEPSVAGSSPPSAPPPDRQASDLPLADPSQKPLVGRDVSRKAVVVSRPEPWYTEEARRAGNTGTVVLRVVLAASGEVSNIHVVVGLAHGLTDQAIDAAKNIKFIPAEKDGTFVSQWIELQYNFNLF